MFDLKLDAKVRSAAFHWLSTQVDVHGDVLPRNLLATGFTFEGDRIPILGPQGIFKPKVMQVAPLSITTSPGGPYDDSFGPNNLLRYRYRGSDPGHADNRGLRFAMEHQLPLVYCHGVVPGRYLATWPVFVVDDDPAGLFCTVAVEDAQFLGLVVGGDQPTWRISDDASAIRRAYLTATVRVRLHQRVFRERVLDAYQRQCAFCRLRHEELLDAAHILPDVEPESEASVRNGLSLCKLHHAAFDSYFLGLRPDMTIEVRPDLLREQDGPALLHLIQGLHGTTILRPRRDVLQPDPAYVEIRYQRFLESRIA